MALPAFLARRRALVESFRPVVADEPRAPSPGEVGASPGDPSASGLTVPDVLSAASAVRRWRTADPGPGRSPGHREGYDYAEARAMARYEARRSQREDR